MIKLRNEIAEVKWDKNAVAKLVKLDSGVYGHSSFQTNPMNCLAVPHDGATMHDGLHLPQGTAVGTSA